MFEIRVEGRFNATHRLRLAGGEWEPVHGHDWRVVVTLQSPRLDQRGMVADFVSVKRSLDETLAEFHYSDLNEHRCFLDGEPSAENVARRIHEQMRGHGEWGARVAAVAVRERPGCWARYRSA